MERSDWIILLCSTLCIFTRVHAIVTPNENTNGYWSYSNQDYWPATYCKGQRQSPINIQDNTAYRLNLGEIEFSPEFYRNYPAVMTNHDYTINISARATISKGGLPSEYVFLFFSFSWPSEHTINNYRYPLEIHFIFYNGKYGQPQNAFSHSDGFVILTGFYYTHQYTNNPIFDYLIDPLRHIADDVYQPSSVSLGNGLVLANFLPSNRQRYYYYRGSFAKPNCDEIVSHYVFPTPSYISQNQLQQLTHILDRNGNLVTRNNRDLQPLNGRDIFETM